MFIDLRFKEGPVRDPKERNGYKEESLIAAKGTPVTLFIRTPFPLWWLYLKRRITL